MNEKIEVLNNILQTRLRYVRNWGQVELIHENGLLTIIWSSFLGDPDNNAFFQSTIYPECMLDKIIKEQTVKLKRDIPANERELLKSIL